jgi:hypothetical protein
MEGLIDQAPLYCNRARQAVGCDCGPQRQQAASERALDSAVASERLAVVWAWASNCRGRRDNQDENHPPGLSPDKHRRHGDKGLVGYRSGVGASAEGRTDKPCSASPSIASRMLSPLSSMR